MSKNRLGELLVKENIITPLQLKKAVESQRATGGRLGHELSKLGYIEESDLTSFLSKQYGVPSVILADFEVSPEVLKILPKEVVTRHQVVPINKSGSVLMIAMADPSNIYAIDDIKFITNLQVEVVVASEQAIIRSHQIVITPPSRGKHVVNIACLARRTHAIITPSSRHNHATTTPRAR